MTIKEAKTIKIGDVLVIKGTTGPDEGKRGIVTKIYNGTRRVAFTINMINSKSTVLDSHGNPENADSRLIGHTKVQKSNGIKVKVYVK